MPTISVIVPVYKVEPYLHRCVDSILSQTYTDFELILVDDGSPDNCGVICDEYAEIDKRVHVIHQPNGGLSAARNSGIDWAFANSSSDWLTFIDSDDWVHPEYLSRLLRAAEETGANVSVCILCKTSSQAPDTSVSEFCLVKMTPESFWCADNTRATVACGKLYRKHHFAVLRYPVGKLHEDEFTTYKILFAEPFVAVLNDALYYYFQNENSIVHADWSPKRLDALDAIEEQILFFERNDFRDALLTQISTYAYLVESYKRQIRGQKGLQRYLKELRQRSKEMLRRHHGKDLFHQAQKLYECAYPFLMKCYHMMGSMARIVTRPKT